MQVAKLNDVYHVRDEKNPLLVSGHSPDEEEQQGEKQGQQAESMPFWWNLLHFLFFFTGGSTFIAGSACYLFPQWSSSDLAAAVLYVIGSVGFLGVDVQEWFTFTTDRCLRCNISLSVCGSTFYVIGSVGFLPSVETQCEWVGPYGFIVGSGFIGCSQLWKVYRIACGGNERNTFSLSNIWSSADSVTQVGVELSAGLGGWFFFFSTLMYQFEDTRVVETFNRIVYLWIAGSIFFFSGSVFLGARHFVMRL